MLEFICNFANKKIDNNYLMADSITIQNNNIMPLVDDLRQIINQAHNRVAVNVNAELTLMYWHIGERINREVLGNERAEYGKQIIATLSQQLQWSHFVEVIPLKDDLQREFYLTLAASERWSIRQLRKEIDGMLYDRTAIATKPDELIKQELSELRENNVLTPDE